VYVRPIAIPLPYLATTGDSLDFLSYRSNGRT
jgi:hypothetical protein